MFGPPSRLLLLPLALSACAAQPQFRFANVFGDHAVLQRDVSSPIWGFSPPGGSVWVALLGHNVTATADGSGVWSVLLPPTPAGGPYVITATYGGAGITLIDIYFGDVFLCGGQSNMQANVAYTWNGTAECERGYASRYHTMRVMTVGHTPGGAPSPLDDLGVIAVPWSVPAPDSICQPTGKASFPPGFSAVCYYTGRDVFDALNATVPIGLISSCASSTAINQWMPAAARAGCPPPTLNDTCNGVAGCLYNSGIAPMARGGAPLALSGVLWYQGENDCGEGGKSGSNEYYSCAFQGLISSWRALFASPTLPFHFVQLSSWASGNPVDVPATRAAQLAALALPGTTAALSYDLGDLSAPIPGHPRNKQGVGVRVAAGVLAGPPYRLPVHSVGPVFVGATAPPAGADGTLVVTVQFNVSCGGVVYTPVACPTGQLPQEGSCEEFAAVGGDGVWRAGTGVGVVGGGSGVRFTVPGFGVGAALVGTRGFWALWPLASVADGCGFPAVPWRVVVGSYPSLVD